MKILESPCRKDSLQWPGVGMRGDGRLRVNFLFLLLSAVLSCKALEGGWVLEGPKLNQLLVLYTILQKTMTSCFYQE